MSVILSIESATECCSVALHKEGQLLGNVELLTGRSTAEMLTTAIENVLSLCKVDFNDLSAIAVSKGPGSYTGLRIGVSTAKGLAYALDLPLLSVNTLDAMIAEVQPFREEGIYFCPMLDARRMEVYCKLSDGLREILETSAVIVDENSFEEELKGQRILFFGPGANKCKTILESQENAMFFSQPLYPKAASMGVLAYKKYCSQAFEDLEAFEPFYLKEFMGTKPTKNKKVVA
ncbi:tRNA (adenosine(37)-N6)-threonylcarbamoyltransferase complex dimerization subunit type 1 TsaB [Marinilongibacter aquaticus]|uniref:tRNA (adenosine(37)-N6)-threonylcarbamoyltransferase complex dimerization subunit type 1 TsaB n=1 Tax=Marinilongibacter aquaticus TaxID=2975157 RepID=UPI0021BD136C|nr:tRNA (adenosine(37)-N6)-threonylcarbamoyltransferase complex dimerization subunit type 1 TsaB [Marinilongibacter aquaticus]UBM58320.1 tRNA (adenosine(37)-N6)-threonylcarbamoyltransferase complex dimerization subunit type 1 TsaB [Marinilongibacter aquaticus]